MSGDGAPALSLVIAALDSGPVIMDTLAALERQRTPELELVVVDASRDDTAGRVRARFPWVRVVEAPSARSLPKLRGLGMAETTGPVVGVLDAWCLPGTGWVAAAIRVHRELPHLVVGGGVDLDDSERRSITAWATYLFDYWEFVPPVRPGIVGALPGNNITYKRSALPDAATLRREGFWKAFTNVRLQKSGHRLWCSPGLAVRLRRRLGLGRFLRSRFHHGRSYGAMRVRGASLAVRLKWAAVTPALPALFLGRQVRGLAGKPGARAWFVVCVPFLVAFHLSWAWGELCGYLAGPGRSDDAIQS